MRSRTSSRRTGPRAARRRRRAPRVLWDRILGFEDLSLLPILAAAIFVYRSEKLLSATSLDDVKDMFSDGSILQVVPLIQTFLFCG